MFLAKSFILSLFLSATAFIVSGQCLFSDLEGTYYGTVDEVNTYSDGRPDFNAQYPFDVHINCDTGIEVSYCSLGCVGNWTLVSKTGNVYTFLEEISSGSCANDVIIKITLVAPGQIDFYVIQDFYLPVPDITINVEAEGSASIATFENLGPYCTEDDSPVLPDATSSGITGTWSPTMVDNSIPGTRVHTFTPDSPHCLPIDIAIDVETCVPIPTISQWGVLTIGLLLMIFGVMSIKAREIITTTQ